MIHRINHAIHQWLHNAYHSTGTHKPFTEGKQGRRLETEDGTWQEDPQSGHWHKVSE